ncbi:glycosyltransferase, partial [Parabacteroides sp. OttesenSCG-928-G21]|nr:glycosyltransferase [Parabacteroides sp. OttesenSCG-928-G21]
MDKHLHVISFNIPYPPNYGGIIDVYYKIKSLHALGVKVILHCFEYERPHAQELAQLCEKVYYYKRKTGLKTNMSLLPYNVLSRKSPALLANLLKDNFPILFEGLHTCYYLDDPRLKKRLKIYRAANIEHHYYRYLMQSGSHWIKNTFYAVEAFRFERFQSVIKQADISLAVSLNEKEYLQKEFPQNRIEFMPCFHANEQVNSETGQSDFILYHGKLSVEENERAAIYLIQQVFSKIKHPCVIAGMNPSEKLIRVASTASNVILVANPSEEEMQRLIHKAQIHVLITFQDTGLKLKLLNSLFAGRHIVANKMMLAGSGLDELCSIADQPEDMIKLCNELFEKPFFE